MIIPNGYCPHKKQIPFHNSTAKFRAIITGVGFGKTAAGANEMLKIALEYPDALHLILAPNSKIMQNATLPQFWKFCPREIIKTHLKSKSKIYLKGGAEIVYLTADNPRHVDRLRGMEVGSFWDDESRLHPGNIWDVLLTRLRDGNGPLKGWTTTTPFGYDATYHYFVKKVHPYTKEPLKNPKDYEWFSGSTLDNPYTPQEYKDNLVAQLGRSKFGRQEIYGEFVGFEGQVYDNFKHDINIFSKKPPIEYFSEFIAGLDWGFVHPCACLIIGLDHDKRAFILEEYYRTRMDVEDVGNWLTMQKKKYPIQNIYADPSRADYISKIGNMGHNIIPAQNAVMPGINFVYTMFEVQKDGHPRIYVHESCQNTVDEINMYRYADNRDGVSQKEEPIKSKDDALDALRYALYSHLGIGGEIKLLQDPEGKIF